MKRDVFDSIFRFVVGQIFLLNLADSMRLHLIDKAGYARFIDMLDGDADRSVDGWWSHPLRSAFFASQVPVMSGRELFSSVVAYNRESVFRADALQDLLDDEPDRRRLSEDASVKILLTTKTNKKIYWLTDRRSLNFVSSADTLRDKLGLDWVDDEMYLYRIDFDYERVITNPLRRPSALCGGTPRFCARRHDESAHRYFKGWGRTIDLRAWRTRKPRARLGGAAELISRLGPVLDGVAGIWFVGMTRSPSGCSSDEDHADFARILNEDAVLQADPLYSQIVELAGRLP